MGNIVFRRRNPVIKDIYSYYAPSNHSSLREHADFILFFILFIQGASLTATSLQEDPDHKYIVTHSHLEAA